MSEAMDVFVTGGTGYIGSRLCATLAARGHAVRALVRPGGGARLPGIATVEGHALVADDVTAALRPGATLVHLVGTPHPNPSKAAEFERVDLASIRVSVDAASRVGVVQLVYVSVAQPAPMMHAYVAVRAAGEAAIAEARLTATILRPWYVLGPGHRWPLMLKPFYAIAKALPATRETARRMDLVSIDDMVAALVSAVETTPPVHTQRIVEVPAIRAAGRGS